MAKVKNFKMNGHDLTAVQLDSDSSKRAICILDDEHNLAYCLSYYTIVAVYDMKREKLYRTWPDWSRSTSHHISLFAKYLYKECSANFTYYDWKNASRDYTEYGHICLPFDFLVNETRNHIKLNDTRVAWWY